jgi:hypothetical protein
MNKYFQPFMLAIPSVAIFANVAVAQPQAQPDKIPVKLQFVISTFDGDRKVSSIPYTFLATANGGSVTYLNGMNVPIQTGDGKITYTNIGININCTVTTETGNFRIAINFDDKSVTTAKTPAAPTGTPTKPPETPTFRDVNYVGTITVKDGETKQLISVPDKGTGEVIKVEVTLTLDPPKRAAIDLNIDHLENVFRALTVQSN